MAKELLEKIWNAAITSDSEDTTVYLGQEERVLLLSHKGPEFDLFTETIFGWPIIFVLKENYFRVV